MNLTELRNEALSFDQAEARPVFVGAEHSEAKEHQAIWNLDKNTLACIASEKYNIAQHQDVIEGVAEALQQIGVDCTARTRNSGNKILVDIQFDNAKLYVQKGEEFLAGIRLINSYDKSTGIMILPRLVRLACSNGMVVNVGFLKEFSVKHTSKLVQDFEKVGREVIKSLVESNEKFKALINNCIGDSVEWEILDRIAAKLFEAKKHREAILEILHKDELTEVTRWDLYNAVTNYVTHNNSLSAGVDIFLQNKAKRILVTPLAQLTPHIEG